MFPLAYVLLIAIIIPIVIWMRYTTSVGKRSQYALANKIDELHRQGEDPVFVCMYESNGSVLVYFGTDVITCTSADGTDYKFAKSDVQTVEYSKYGFFRIVTTSGSHRFAYVHKATDAKGLNTMVFGPSYRDDAAIAEFVAAVTKFGVPIQEVPHKSLIFLPQIKV